jgi:hypothetical protein
MVEGASTTIDRTSRSRPRVCGATKIPVRERRAHCRAIGRRSMYLSQTASTRSMSLSTPLRRSAAGARRRVGRPREHTRWSRFRDSGRRARRDGVERLAAHDAAVHISPPHKGQARCSFGTSFSTAGYATRWPRSASARASLKLGLTCPDSWRMANRMDVLPSATTRVVSTHPTSSASQSRGLGRPSAAIASRTNGRSPTRAMNA